MFIWKTDPLYRLVFGEVESLWRRLRAENAREHTPFPEAFRIEEHTSLPWDSSPGSHTLKDVWIFDDAGPRLFPGLRRVPHDRGSRQGEAWQFGLIRFYVLAEHSHVALFHDVGPQHPLESRYRIQTPSEPVELVLEEARSSLGNLFR